MPSNSTPCILCRGEQLFLSVDKIPLFVVASHNVALLLTAAHYVFDIAYPTGLEQVFSFFEFVFLGKHPQKQGNTFSRVFAELNCL